MSTELYPPLPKEEIASIERSNQLLEQRWLISTLIKPELDNVLEVLTRCIELMTDTTPISLPFSSARTEQAKGVLTREGSEISRLNVTLHMSTVSKKLELFTRDTSHIEMEQLMTLTVLLNETMAQALILKEHDTQDCHGFVKQLELILSNLTKCTTTMNKPPERLLFPQHKINLTEVFKPDGNKLDHYKDRITMDLFMLNGEITVEIKSLHIVTEEPWCQVDPTTGKSHVDKLREDLKHHRIKITDILEPEESTYKRGLSLLGINKFTPHDYLTRSVTHDGKVVIEVEKAVVHCQDPNLLSIGAKLNGLEHLVSKMYSNLDLAMM